MMARTRAVLRLLGLQASWTYERMQGIGMAVTMEPLLEPLSQWPERARAARGRSAGYFNAHPFLAGAATGALARAELEEVPGERIQRLRTAMSGPLGALGDQLFWAGVVPAAMALALVAVVLGGGLPAVGAVVVAYNAARLGVTVWGLRLGWAHGLGVAAAISHSRLPVAAARAGDAAAFLIGLAVPLTAFWLLHDSGEPTGGALGVIGVAAGFGLVTLRRPIPAPTLTVAAAAVVLLWRWSLA